MIYSIDEALKALENTYANGSDELDKGIGTANGSPIKVKLPDGTLRTIEGIEIKRNEEHGSNEAVIILT